jgi:hypothetical protein
MCPCLGDASGSEVALRWLRIRIAGGLLLILVVVFAANCEVLRRLYDSVKDTHGTFPLWGGPWGEAVGLLPLANAAVVGASFVLSRAVGSSRGQVGRVVADTLTGRLGRRFYLCMSSPFGDWPDWSCRARLIATWSGLRR